MQTMRDQRRVSREICTQAHRQLWEQLAERAHPILTFHRADLLWDWEILKTYWDPEGFDFYWSVRESGTWIAQDAEQANKTCYRDAPNAWFVSVRKDRYGDLRAEFREMRDPVEALK
jgi:hypothetical protein